VPPVKVAAEADAPPLEDDLDGVPLRDFMPPAEVDAAADAAEDPAPPEPAAPLRPRRLTMKLIGEQSLDDADAASLNADEYADRVLGLKRLRLGHLRLGAMDGLDPCNGATHIYLQHNLISELDGLDFFTSLQFLVLSHNNLTEVAGVSHLASLLHLDIAHNQIQAVVKPATLFPPSLLHLNLAANPCAALRGHRRDLLAALPTLKRLDDLAILPWERGEEEDEETGGDTAEEQPASASSAGTRGGLSATGGSSHGESDTSGPPVDAAQGLYSFLRPGSEDASGRIRSKLAQIRERSRRRRAEVMEDTSVADAIARIASERERAARPGSRGGGPGRKGS